MAGQSIPPVQPPKASVPEQETGVPVSVTEAKDILQKAQKAYDSLSGDGLNQLQCQVIPDVDSMFKDIKTDDGGLQLLPLLKQVKFRVVIGSAGTSTVSHDSAVAPPTEYVAARLRQAIAGIEQMVTGFLQTWTGFAIKPALLTPDDTTRVERVGNKYRISTTSGTTEVIVTMSADSVIQELKVKSPQFDGTVRPSFTATKHGLVLSGYESSYKAEQAAGDLTMTLTTQELDGLPIPKTVLLKAVTVAQTITVPLTFSDCQATKRQ